MTDRPTKAKATVSAETAGRSPGHAVRDSDDAVRGSGDAARDSDDVLYRRFLDGDTAGFDQLMGRYGDSVIRYLYGYVHDPEEAEDLMIDAFARICVKKPDIGEGAFKAYLYRTARNLALRFFERRRLQTFSIDGIEGAGGMDGMEAQIPDRATVESDLAERERRRVLYACLKRIEPQLREALWLVYIEGMTYAQAAGVLSVKPKRIDRLLARGKEAMRRELEKEGVTGAYE